MTQQTIGKPQDDGPTKKEKSILGDELFWLVLFIASTATLVVAVDCFPIVTSVGGLVCERAVAIARLVFTVLGDQLLTLIGRWL